jgi:hypothetical protein
MSGTYNPYATYMNIAFRGMKVDSMEDNVDTFAANADLAFGIVVGRDVAGALTVVPGTGVGVVGMTLHDHIIASRGGYIKTDPVSVLTRGRVWAWVAGAGAGIAGGAPVFYDAASGMVQGSGGVQLLHATFRSSMVTVPNIAGGSANIAAVELHYPFQSQASGAMTRAPETPEEERDARREADERERNRYEEVSRRQQEAERRGQPNTIGR